MDLRQPETWQRHQLATIERMQADIGRYTRRVMNFTSTSSIVYLTTWGPLCAFWDVGEFHLLPLSAAALSGLVVTLGFPAFALAAGIEAYFRSRLQDYEE